MATSNAKVASSVSVVLGQTERSAAMENVVTKEARGPFVYSMLDGDALTAVEHLELQICG